MVIPLVISLCFNVPIIKITVHTKLINVIPIESVRLHQTVKKIGITLGLTRSKLGTCSSCNTCIKCLSASDCEEDWNHIGTGKNPSLKRFVSKELTPIRASKRQVICRLQKAVDVDNIDKELESLEKEDVVRANKVR